MKKQYQEPEIEIISYKMDEPIAAGSSVDNDFPLDGDVID